MQECKKCEKCAECARNDLLDLGNLFGMYFGVDSIFQTKKKGGGGKSCRQGIEQPPQVREDKTG